MKPAPPLKSPPDIQAAIAAVARIPAVPTILDLVCRITGMGFAAVARVTDDRWVACSVNDHIRFGLHPGGELKLESTICNEIRDHHRAVVINHVAEDPLWRHHHTPATYGFQSYISMPIILSDGGFFGTLCAIDPQPRSLDTPEITGMFKLFAELIAFHLNAVSYLAKSAESLSQEREVSALREQFIAVLGHDLRNPLQAISAGISLLLRRPEQAPVVAPLMRNSIDRMAGLITNVMDFAQGRLGGGIALDRAKTGSAESVLWQIISETRTTSPDRAIETAFDLRENLQFDPHRLAQLFSNLLGNAITHGAPDQAVHVCAVAADGIFELSVANAGDPLSPEVLNNLFQPFFRATTRPTRQGLGLGLYIAAEIARAHGGGLEASSTAAETRFTFRMPTAPADET